jgi:aquaporin Z
MPEALRHPAAALKSHWPEYALEALEVALLMTSACLIGVALLHPASPLVQGIDSALRRALTGIAMGLTVLGLIHSPMGRRSGAHMNPAVTLVFWRLGKVAGWDAAFYMMAQFAGAALGMLAMSAVLGGSLAHTEVRFVTTTPGAAGAAAAWVGEFVIALLMMFTVLTLSNSRPAAPFTGLGAALLVAAFIFVESPVSGTSMNPARTFGSSLAARIWTGLWIYFTAPPLAMLAASELYLRTRRGAQVYCAKLNHVNSRHCIFRCRFHEMIEERATAAHAEAS